MSLERPKSHSSFGLIWGKAADVSVDLIHKRLKLRTASAVSWGEKRSMGIRWKSR